jgi:rhodanese-related sulfurtransferase
MQIVKKIVTITLLLSAIVFSACSQVSIPKDAVLIDVRTPEEYLEGSAKGAINIPLNEIQAEATKLDSTKTIVVFCRSGSRAKSAKDILEQMGFKKVINGGTWQKVNKQVK